MINLLLQLYNWLLSLFWATQIDITILGLQNSGKTSLLRVLAGEEFTEETPPTVGFNMKQVQKGHVTLKCWDLGGQPRFRSMWERYCREVNAILFIVDSTNQEALMVAREELVALLENESLSQIPVLILANKSDLRDAAMAVDEIIDRLLGTVPSGGNGGARGAVSTDDDDDDGDKSDDMSRNNEFDGDRLYVTSSSVAKAAAKANKQSSSSSSSSSIATATKNIITPPTMTTALIGGGRQIGCYAVSAKTESNLDAVIQWLLARAK